MYFKTNLSYLRRRRNLTQEAVADLLGLSPQAIALYERGDREPSLINLIKLAQFFQVSIDDFLIKDLRPDSLNFGKNLAFLRKKYRARGEDIAEIFGVSKSTYSKYENGLVQPNMEGLVIISEFFGVSVDDLLKKDLSKEG